MGFCLHDIFRRRVPPVGRTKRAVALALEKAGWEVHLGMEPGVIDIEANRGAELWLVRVVHVFTGQTEQQAMPPSRKIKRLVSGAGERQATPVLGFSKGGVVVFKEAPHMSPVNCEEEALPHDRQDGVGGGPV